ncbi:conserved hypothetical protein, secreted [Candidatus Omnitrophus magneticus]|uniref:Uncharacterized protein n=1 Tax=Candidatus Omnitrophus magneticus TaxID=1609969 RepID=A0A0F0CS45_9BACT|nr:conserved hypothetical protein, secreted [Candidatus Omnitrophus magneticus]
MNTKEKTQLSKIFKIFIFIISPCLAFLLSSCAHKILWEMPDVFEKGIICPKWEEKGFYYSDFRKILSELREKSGIKYTQLDVIYYQTNINSFEIFPINSYGILKNKNAQITADNNLITSIKNAKKAGLKIVLIPKIKIINNEENTYSREDIGFSNEEDWKKWFTSYEKFILHYADLAQKYEIDFFSVGEGLFMTLNRTDHWQDIIMKTKRKYSGNIVFTCDWNNYKIIEKWPDIDYIAINCYFSVAENYYSPLSEIQNGFDKWNSSIKNYMETKREKPVIFTEIGHKKVLDK